MSTHSTAETRVTEEFCVMTPDGPHIAYTVKPTVEAARQAIEFDGHPGLTVARRTRTVTTSPWQPLDAEGPATRIPTDRIITLKTLDGAAVSFGVDQAVASDTVMLVYAGPVLLGWADDYGTVTHPDHDLDPDVKAAAERLVAVAGEVLALLAEASE